jgi:hypothetical protein
VIDVDAAWRSMEEESAPPGGGQLRRRIPVAVYDIFLTQERPSRLPGLFVTVTEPAGTLWKELRGSAGLDVRVDARPGQPASMQVTERDTRFHEVFSALVTDLVAVVDQAAVTPAELRPLLMDLLAGRIARWQTALRAHNDGLSSEKRAGLFGELNVLSGLINAGADPALVVENWTGPSEAVQDFQYESLTIEVKASRQTQPTNVRISSERQLDTSAQTRLLLIHFGLDERSDGSGIALPEKVAQVRQLVGRSSHAGLLLDDRLIDYGYLDVHAPRYADSSYVIRAIDYFDVRDPMPRIVENDLPVGVGRVSYDLSLAACEPFRIDEETAKDAFATVAP